MSIPAMLTSYYHNFSDLKLLPGKHVNFLKALNIKPTVVYDLGSCVLHWANEAKKIWPDVSVYAVDAMPELEDFYEQKKGTVIADYAIAALSDKDNVETKFYCNIINPGGNSLKRELNDEYFPVNVFKEVKTQTLDSIVKKNKWPQPDLIKIDCQNLESLICLGAAETLKKTRFLIAELQHREWNENAEMAEESIKIIEGLGFKCLGCFCQGLADGDYYFVNIQLTQYPLSH
jgi:FkbM family methyltransferase